MRAMKDSGIEWIGEIPENWELNKIGAVYDERSTKVSDKDYQPLSVTKQGIVPQLESAAKSDDNDNRKLIKKNDFVINSRSDRRGSCGISEYDGSCSLINTVLEATKKNMCNTYYSYVFRSEPFGDEFYRWGNGIVDDLWSTKWSNMKRIYIPSPSIEEQRKIADYLDDKCAKIDSIVEKQQAVIEKLKEYKLSVITEAVTEGIRPTENLKDSTIPWIGEIPSTFKVVQLSRILKNIRNGYVGPTRNLFFDEGVRYIQSLHIKDGKIDFEKHPYYVSEEWAEKHPKIHTGDVLIVQTGDIGQVGLVTPQLDGCNCHALLILSVESKMAFPKYIMYYFRSTVGKELLLNTSTGALLPHLNAGKVKNVSVICPSLTDQEEIVTFLDNKCKDIDHQIDGKQSIVEKLKEYKKSLIYEVVTGKKEV